MSPIATAVRAKSDTAMKEKMYRLTNASKEPRDTVTTFNKVEHPCRGIPTPGVTKCSVGSWQIVSQNITIKTEEQ